ncbi:type II toxin-antitoxin system RelE/ParE family toxin [Flavobacterium sp.]|uniref:type II toxin-antitoxin system RelE/ParE family toxin n=1 Tax=Flavobacterium sp. TaxID=239 RepID=UPI00263336A4|nr:type II toxin-antitoxin system RelE/ParE family toxin [Flavobacterium sp.]
MKSGYKILWTDFALKELEQTFRYLEENWSETELRNLATNIEEKLVLIAQNPYLFQESEFKKGIRRVIILKYNTLYYRFSNEQVEIIAFFFKQTES